MPAKTQLPKKEQALLIFPNQLIRDHPGIQAGRTIFLIEYQLFFGDWNYFCLFHKQKILLHLSSMQVYEEELKERGLTVSRIPYERKRGFLDSLFNNLSAQGFRQVITLYPHDLILEKRLRKVSKSNGLSLSLLSNPSFLIGDMSPLEIPPRGKRYSMTSFYIQMRKKYDLLLTPDGKPLGGKWSFDPMNRRKLPSTLTAPPPLEPSYPFWMEDLAREVERAFPHNPGSTRKFFWPISRSQALHHLDHFLEFKLPFFGDYEDAMDIREPFLFHSLLSSSLNIGLLSPLEVLHRTMETFSRGKISLNSAEGFIRQILGWREFMKLIYHKEGVRIRTSNFWGHHRAMPERFLHGNTGLDPVDQVIGKVNQYSYAHHIERLMILGNYLLLSGIHPVYVYNWFMGNFIDAFDWVMTPNVFGMSQFSDGGSMVTKPYICSSSYILRMSNYPRGEWTSVMDSLFWRFVHIHRKTFKDIPRLGMIVSNLDRMSKTRLGEHLSIADEHLEGIK